MKIFKIASPVTYDPQELEVATNTLNQEETTSIIETANNIRELHKTINVNLSAIRNNLYQMDATNNSINPEISSYIHKIIVFLMRTKTALEGARKEIDILNAKGAPENLHDDWFTINQSKALVRHLQIAMTDLSKIQQGQKVRGMQPNTRDVINILEQAQTGITNTNL